MAVQLRRVRLEGVAQGALYLCEMPGRCAPLDAYLAAFEEAGIDRIVCLAEREEMGRKSPEYLRALEEGALHWPVEHFPIGDFGLPRDRKVFAEFVQGLARGLREGETLLIHCGAGIGRTGTVTACLLRALGLGLEEAFRRVQAAGSKPETADQRQFVQEFQPL